METEMPEYTEKDLRRVKTYGRVEMFREGFLGRMPRCPEIIAATFEQMLVLGCSKIAFGQDGEYYSLSSRHSWIRPGTLKAAIDGGLLPFPEMGANSTRIESFYRYLFRDVAYAENGSIHEICGSFTGEALRLIPEDAAYSTIILGHFGQYNWDETRTYY